MHRPRSIMNPAPWTVQVLWGVFFSPTGLGKIMCYRPAVWNQALHQVAWFPAVQLDLFIFIGVCGSLGGIGLIRPTMTGGKPKLRPLAAFGLAAVMILVAVFHIVRGEYNFLPTNPVLGGAAAFIAYGRWSVRPVAPRSISTFGVLKGSRLLARWSSSMLLRLGTS